MKDDLFQKNTRKYDIFLWSFDKKVFSKGAAPGHYLSCIIWKDGIDPKQESTIFFPWAGSQRWSFPRNTWKYDIFCVHVWVLETWCHAPAKKHQGWPYPTKIHLKVTDVLDWHPGKSSSNSLYLHRDLYGHVLLSSEKNQET